MYCFIFFNIYRLEILSFFSSEKILFTDETISDGAPSLLLPPINETKRRREIQEEYNKANGITPKTIIKAIPKSITMKQVSELSNTERTKNKALSKEEKIALINELEEEMKAYAKELNFEAAAQVRDAILELKAKR